jgi:hypothetical protein
MINRMVRAAQFDGHLYEEVERDVDATGQAATVVAIVAIATGIGGLREGGIFGLIFGVVGALVGWVVWSAITYWVGKNIFKTHNTQVTLGEMLRTLGFAQSPGVLNILGLIPVLGALVSLIVGIWVLVLGVIAIRHAMDFSTGRAIGTALVGFIPYIIILAILAAITGGVLA